MFRFFCTNITSIRQTSTTKYNCFVSKKFFFIDGFFGEIVCNQCEEKVCQKVLGASMSWIFYLEDIIDLDLPLSLQLYILIHRCLE